MVEDRRRFQRVALDSPIALYLDESENGLVLDLCEDGVAVSDLTAGLGQIVRFVFDLPERSGRIWGRAEVVWKSDSAHRAGLHFLDLAHSCRAQIINWISSRAWTMRAAGVEQEYSDMEAPNLFAPAAVQFSAMPERLVDGASPQSASPAPDPLGVDFGPGGLGLGPIGDSSRPSASNRKSQIALGAFLAFCVLGILAYRSREIRVKPQAASNVPAAVQPPPAPPAAAEMSAPVSAPATAPSSVSAPASVSTPAPVSAPAAAAPLPAPVNTAPRLDDRGFVLQVAAMSHEENADALAKQLQQKKFPAFVYSRGGDHLYRVAVGPFRDKNSPAKIKQELEKQSLKPFLRPWVPE